MLQSTGVIGVVSSDYDGTIANTFTPSSSGMSVTLAYKCAIGDIFGSQSLFDDIGGLQNRAPAEIIAAILKCNRLLGNTGLQYFKRNHTELSGLVPKGKGIRLNSGTADLLTETLVRVKLKYLLHEISNAWPKPYEGFLDALEEFERQAVYFAVITSGHDRFLERSFELWKAPKPAFTVTDDDMRMFGLPAEDCCKPSSLLIDTLMCKIQMSMGATVKGDIKAYIGDCPVKDRGLAWSANLRFGLFNPDDKPKPSGFGRNEFEFSCWRQLPAML